MARLSVEESPREEEARNLERIRSALGRRTGGPLPVSGFETLWGLLLFGIGDQVKEFILSAESRHAEEGGGHRMESCGDRGDHQVRLEGRHLIKRMTKVKLVQLTNHITSYGVLRIEDMFPEKYLVIIIPY